MGNYLLVIHLRKFPTMSNCLTFACTKIINPSMTQIQMGESVLVSSTETLDSKTICSCQSMPKAMVHSDDIFFMFNSTYKIIYFMPTVSFDSTFCRSFPLLVYHL